MQTPRDAPIPSMQAQSPWAGAPWGAGNPFQWQQQQWHQFAAPVTQTLDGIFKPFDRA